MVAQKQTDLEGIIVDSNELVNLRAASREIKLENRVKSHSIMDGSSKSSRRGRGMEFSEVRHYQAGDDIRNIDWRVTARTQETYTKLYQEEKERPVYLLLDQRSDMFFGSNNQFKSVLAAKIAASIAWAAFLNRDKLGALIFSDVKQTDLRPKQGKSTLFRFLHEVADFSQQLLLRHTQNNSAETPPQPTFTGMIQELQRVARPGSLIFIISDFHDYTEETTKALTLLSRHNDIELIQVTDPLESSLPKLSHLPISKAGKRLVINSTSHVFQERYTHEWSSHQEQLSLNAIRLGATFKSLSTHIPLNEHLRSMFLGLGKKRA